MCVEYAQMLCGAIRVSDPAMVEDWMYKLTHQHHPCAVWLRQSTSNWIYLRDLALALGDEYNYRYGGKKDKRHKSIEAVVKRLKVPNLPLAAFTEPPQCVSEECISDDVVEAYRKYYITDKADIGVWTKRESPCWWKNA